MTEKMEVFTEKKGVIAQRFEQAAEAMIADAQGVEVFDARSQAAALELREQARQLVKAIEEEFEPDKKKAHELWKSITSRISRMTDGPKKVIEIVSGKVSDYLVEQERERALAAEKARLAAEEEERREREKLLKKAEALAEKGKALQAEQVRAEAEMVFVPVPEATAKVNGLVETGSGKTSARPVWDVIVVNPLEVIRAVADGRLPLNVLEIKVGPLTTFARMNISNDPGVPLPTIPGCKLQKGFQLSGRAK